MTRPYASLPLLPWAETSVGGMTLRQATPQDAEPVAVLMAEPAVEQWWHQAWSTERWRETIHDQLASGPSLPLVLVDDGTVVGYVELYPVARDVLGRLVRHEDSDLGVHLALGAGARGRGIGPRLLTAVRERAEAVLPGCRRVLAEPDLRNEASAVAFRRAGFRSEGEVDLPDKRARLMVASLRPATEHVPDVAAVGVGPFNLGLAALADPVADLDVVCFDRAAELTWHRGLMLEDSMLQVSFLADLVTLVDPTSRHSFLAYLREEDRMYPFYVREQFHPSRREYEDYLRWVARRLPSVRFGHDVREVRYDASADVFELEVRTGSGVHTHRARHVVLGVGTEPRVPSVLSDLPEQRLMHAGDYLHRQEDLERAERVTVVGSGQSGAECVLDLLRRSRPSQQLTWLTRSGSFAPLDYSKLVLEMTTPAYVDHFHRLDEERRDALVAEQWRHYKGISGETLDALHDALYQRLLEEKASTPELRPGAGVVAAETDDDEVVLRLRDADTGATLRHETDLVVAATGYRERPMPLDPTLRERLHTDRRGRPAVRRDHSVAADGPLAGRVFVANADLHTHGPAAPDLGIGAVRNAGILNAVAGREVYPLPRRTAFTTFGATSGAAR